MDKLTSLIKDYVTNPEDPEKNFKLACEYDSIGQTASAYTFYMRAAERYEDVLMQYVCLLRCATCFEKQGYRSHTVSILLKHAICLLPKRPEAYFMLSRMYEMKSEHVDSYVYAQIALGVIEDSEPLPYPVDYPGQYGLIFEKAVSSWYWGKGMEARKLFLQLKSNYKDVMSDMHKTIVQNNLMNLGSGPEDVSKRPYVKSQHSKLRNKFDKSDEIEYNYSQVFQDMFVLQCLNGKTNGTYVEVGSARPFYGNNTALLEKLGWTGIGFEIREDFVNQYNAERRNKVLKQDATTADYNKILKDIAVNGVVDYLQLDIEPPNVTFEALLAIPFDNYKFAVITYEHDYYIDMTGTYRDKSRKYLRSLGYELVVGNVSPTEAAPFEDWWVHPDLVDRETIDRLKCSDRDVIPIEDYMFIKE